MGVTSVALELNGRPVVVRNTFIDVDEVPEFKATHKRNSAPASSPVRNADMSPEELRQRLLSTCRQASPERSADRPHEKLRARLLDTCRQEAPPAGPRVYHSTEVCSPESSVGLCPGAQRLPLQDVLRVDALACSDAEVVQVDAPACSDAEVASTVSTQAPAASCLSGSSSFDSLGSVAVPLAQAPRVRFGGPAALGAWAGCQPEYGWAPTGWQTTLMFRNLPEEVTRAYLEHLLEVEGFGGRYDFLYLPADLCSGACFGYALINLVTPSDAFAFIGHFQGFQRWSVPSEKCAVAHMSQELQGLAELLKRYRNSPIMHRSVPDALRPAVYYNGFRAPFPQPTAPVKPPRAKKASRRTALRQQFS